VRLTSTTKGLSEGLQWVGRAVSGRSILPILSNVMLEAKEGALRLLATDLELWIEDRVPAQVAEEGAITIPARIVNEVVGSLPAAEISLQAEDSKALTLVSGHSQYLIQGLPAAEFPHQPQVGKETTFEVPQAAFREVIKSVIFAAARDQTRIILTGAQLAWDSRVLRLAATDMHRLAVNSMTIGGDPVGPPSAGQENYVVSPLIVTVPGRALSEVMRALASEGEEKISITVGENQIVFSLGDLVVTSRLIEGQFPNWERVMPTQTDKRVTAGRDALATAIKRAAIVAHTDETNRVMLRTNNGILTILAETGDVGRAHEEVEIQLEGEELEIGFDARYLLDVMEVIATPAVLMEFGGSISAGLIRPTGEGVYRYVVMPMQAP